jgi:phenylacetate-coenzyme A ligase PaaK-like adenylate-forming protein
MKATIGVDARSTRQELRAGSLADFESKIPIHLDRLGWTAETIAAHQRTELRRLLAHALEGSPFHARRLRAIDPATFELGDLATLPVMTKGDMMESFDEVVTDRRLSRRLVEEQLAATDDEASFLLDEYVCLASGGSSGLRGIFVWERGACSDFLLGVVRSALANVIAAGGPPPGGVPTAVVAAGSAIHATKALTSIFSGGPFRISSVPATLPIEEIVRQLNDLQPSMLIGYSAMLGMLAAEQGAGRLQIRPASVTGTSELFTAELKARVSAAFDAPVIDSFGSSEGLIGTAPPGDAAISLAADLAIVELVDDDNQPVAPDTPSAKVLVTSLLNRAQPLIRYELTDRMVAQPPAATHGYPRVTVEGRADEVFSYGRVHLHPFVVRSVLASTPAITEYRVHQTASGVAIEVVAAADLDSAAVERRLGAALAEAGLRAPTAEVTTVARIERQSDTGKLARFIPLP